MKPTPDKILEEMAATFKERGAIYGDNWKRIGKVMFELFGGEPFNPKTPEDYLRLNLLELIVMKVTRLAATDIAHYDSALDIGVYSAMLASLIKPDAVVLDITTLEFKK